MVGKRDYKEFCAVARRSLGNIPAKVKTFAEVLDIHKAYHVDCYKLFTDQTKLQRAINIQDSVKSPDVTRSSKRVALHPPISSPQRNSHHRQSSATILPKQCLVCKKSGPIRVMNKVCTNDLLISSNIILIRKK